MNKPVAWVDEDIILMTKDGRLTLDWFTVVPEKPFNDDETTWIPLYTQDKLEEARQQGMRQERALWNLAKSTQEIEASQSQDIDLKETSFQTALNKEMKGKEPVAVRYDFDGYGYQYMDSGSGSDWKTRIKDAELLYTQDCVNQLQAENKELHAIAQRMAMAESDARKSLQNIKDRIPHENNLRIKPIYVEKYPVKELTDEEILKFIDAFCTDMGNHWELSESNALEMIKAILRKAQEK